VQKVSLVTEIAARLAMGLGRLEETKRVLHLKKPGNGCRQFITRGVKGMPALFRERITSAVFCGPAALLEARHSASPDQLRCSRINISSAYCQTERARI